MMRAAIKAAFTPLHRHSLPQLLADGLLLAAAYILAFALRFEGSFPPSYQRLRNETVWWAVLVGLAVLVAQRAYLAIARAMARATAIQVALIAVVHPVKLHSSGRLVGLSLPDSVVALYFLLATALLIGWRVAARTIHERGVVGM